MLENIMGLKISCILLFPIFIFSQAVILKKDPQKTEKTLTGVEKKDEELEKFKKLIKEKAGDEIFEMGEKLLNQNKYDSLIKLYKLFLEENKESIYQPYMFYHMAWAYIYKKEYDSSIEYLKKALKKLPEEEKELNEDIICNIGECYFKKEKYDKAIEWYSKITPGGKYYEQAKYGIAFCRYKQKDYKKAEWELKRFIRQFPKSSIIGNVRKLLAKVYLDAGRSDKAARVFEEIADDPMVDDVVKNEAYFLGGGTFFEAKEYLKAIEFYGKVRPKEEILKEIENKIKLYQKKQERLRLWMGEGSSSERFKLAMQSRINYWKKMQENVKEAEDYRPKSLYYIGLCFSKMKRPKQAIAMFKKVLREYPGSPVIKDVQQSLAAAYLKLGDLAGAKSELEERIRKEKKDAPQEIRFALLMAYYNTNDYENLIEKYNQGIFDFEDQRFAEPASFRIAASYEKLASIKKDPQLCIKSINLYDQFIKKYPESTLLPLAKFSKANCLEEMNKLDETLTIYEEIYKEYPKLDFKDQLLYRLGLLCRKKKLYNKSEMYFNTFLNTFDKSEYTPYVFYEKGNLYLAMNEPQKAKKVFEELIQKYRDNDLAIYSQISLANYYRMRGKFDSMQSIYAAMIDNFPESKLLPHAYYWIGWNLKRKKKFKEGIDYFRKIVDKYPDSKFAPMAQLAIADSLAEDKKLVCALDEYEKVIFYENPKLSEKALGKISEIYSKLGQKKKAISFYKELIKKYSDNQTLVGKIYSALGRTYYEKKNYKKAIEIFKQAENISDKMLGPLGYNYYGKAHLKLGNFNLAYKIFKAAIERFGSEYENRQNFISLAEAYLKINPTKYSLSKKAKELLESYPWKKYEEAVFLTLARCSLKVNDIENAQRYYKLVASQSETDTKAEALYYLGKFLYDKQKYKDALSYLIRVNVLYEHSKYALPALYQAGRCYERLGDKEKACNLYKNLIEKFKENKYTKMAKGRLQKLGGVK